MKRSEINREITTAIALLEEHHFAMPPFAHWSPSQWKQVGPEANEIRSRALGWDVTDFGSGAFHRIGLTVFTIRNGRVDDPKNKKVYAEKILIVGEDQVTPYHYHFSKTEDILNRGGGDLALDLRHRARLHAHPRHLLRQRLPVRGRHHGLAPLHHTSSAAMRLPPTVRMG